MQQVFSAYQERCSRLSKGTHPFANGVAWVAGDLVPLHEAKIPLMDQGFLHSDLTYDVPAVWDGRFFRLDDHLDRFELSCSKIRLILPHSKAEIKKALIKMISESGIRDAFVEIICTRGMQGVRDQMMSTGPTSPHNLYMFITPYVWVMQPEMQLKGTGFAVITRTVRRTPPGAFDPTVKNLQWGDLTRGMFEAVDRGAHYPFLTDGDGNLTEGSGFNIVLIKDNILYTPDRGVLEGVTRKSVMEVAKRLGYEVRLEVVPVGMCYQADEIFMCTTAGGVMPITRLDGEVVGDGKVGRVTGRIWDGYWAMHYEEELSFEVNYHAKARL